MRGKKFNFCRFLVAFLAMWSGVLLIHFLAIILKTAAVAAIEDVPRAYELVARPWEVLLVALGAIIVAVVVSIFKFGKKDSDVPSE